MNKADLQNATMLNNQIEMAKAQEQALFSAGADVTLVVLSYQGTGQQARQINLDLRKGARPFQIVLSDATLAAINADVKASLEKVQSDNTTALKTLGVDITV